MNKINLSYFEEKKYEEIKEKRKIENSHNDTIKFQYFDSLFNFDYSGIKIIKNNNTNKFIRGLINDDENVNSNISVNDFYIKNKDIIIISPFTKMKDILSSRVNGNVHNYLKNKSLLDSNSNIEKTIVKEYQVFDEVFDLTDINLTKVDIINYIDIKDEFVSENNIKQIFNILNDNNNKKLIIFNDVDYLKIYELEDFLVNFNFIFVVNSYDNTYEVIENFEDFVIFTRNKSLNDWYQENEIVKNSV
ncbi:MAG: hypothetical protein KFW07_03730 [Mycoplasmataceae bacterium]|nr:hypothetical protein [Mycoplasmataceae bacterium]